jgi:hypothetical protein
MQLISFHLYKLITSTTTTCFTPFAPAAASRYTWNVVSYRSSFSQFHVRIINIQFIIFFHCTRLHCCNKRLEDHLFILYFLNLYFFDADILPLSSTYMQPRQVWYKSWCKNKNPLPRLRQFCRFCKNRHNYLKRITSSCIYNVNIFYR